MPLLIMYRYRYTLRDSEGNVARNRDPLTPEQIRARALIAESNDFYRATSTEESDDEYDSNDKVTQEEDRMLNKKEFEKYLGEYTKNASQNELIQQQLDWIRMTEAYKRAIREITTKKKFVMTRLEKGVVFDYDLIKEDSRVHSLDAALGNVRIVTKDIILSHLGKYFYIGPLKLEVPLLNFKNLQIRRSANNKINKDLTVRKLCTSNYTHPHFTDGACLGSYEEHIIGAYNNSNFTLATFMLLEFLFSYNASSPLVHIQAWPACDVDGNIDFTHAGHDRCPTCSECRTCEECEMCPRCRLHPKIEGCTCCSVCGLPNCRCSCIESKHEMCKCERCRYCYTCHKRNRSTCVVCYNCECCNMCSPHDLCRCERCNCCGLCKDHGLCKCIICTNPACQVCWTHSISFAHSAECPPLSSYNNEQTTEATQG